jgi:hypothetical protein
MLQDVQRSGKSSGSDHSHDSSKSSKHTSNKFFQPGDAIIYLLAIFIILLGVALCLIIYFSVQDSDIQNTKVQLNKVFTTGFVTIQKSLQTATTLLASVYSFFTLVSKKPNFQTIDYYSQFVPFVQTRLPTLPPWVCFL